MTPELYDQDAAEAEAEASYDDAMHRAWEDELREPLPEPDEVCPECGGTGSWFDADADRWWPCTTCQADPS